MEELSSVIIVIIAILSIVSKLSKKSAKNGAQKRGMPIVPYAEPDEPQKREPVQIAEPDTPAKKSSLDAFTDMLRKLDIDVPDISGAAGKPPKPAMAQPSRDPAPRPGHEAHDPTEGSIELSQRSPEGKANTISSQPVKAAEPAAAASIAPKVSSAQLRNAVVMAEVLARPVALRQGGRRL